jgi:hypothetical protein
MVVKTRLGTLNQCGIPHQQDANKFEAAIKIEPTRLSFPHKHFIEHLISVCKKPPENTIKIMKTLEPLI